MSWIHGVSKDEELGIVDDVNLTFRWGKIRGRYIRNAFGAVRLESLDFELDVMFDDDARVYMIKFECSPIKYENITVAFDCHASINGNSYNLIIPYNKLY